MKYLKQYRHNILLGTIVILALGLRLWGVGFGLPYVGYHPDEYAVSDGAMLMLKTGQLSPQAQSAYALHSYLQYIVGKILISYRSFASAPVDVSQIRTETAERKEGRFGGGIGFPYAFPEYYLWGRIVVAVLGSGTVWVTCLLARRLFSPRAGLLAAAFLAVSPLHARDSHFLTTGVPGTFFLVLAVYWIFRAHSQRQWVAYLPATLFSAAAMYTKRNGYIILVLWLFLLVANAGRGIKGKKYGQALGLPIVVILGLSLALVLSTPAAWDSVGPLNIFNQVVTRLHSHIFDYEYVYAGTHLGASGENTWWWMISRLLSDPWRYITILSVPGLYFLGEKYLRVAWLWLVPAAYFLFLSFFATRFDRWLLPLIPFLAIQAALTVDTIVEYVQHRYRQAFSVRLGSQLIVGLLVAMPMVTVVQTDYLLTQKDVRVLAAEWIMRHIPEGSGLAVGNYGPYIPRDKYRVEYLRVEQHEIETYQKYGAEYIVLNSAWYRPLYNDPERYAQEVAQHNRLLNSPFPKTVISGPFLGLPGREIVIINIQPRTENK